MQFGVIGCGRVSQIMDDRSDRGLGGERARRTGDRYRVPHRYWNGAELIKEVGSDLNAVVDATPPHTHREIGIAGLEAGLHTFIETPLALIPEDADALVEAAVSSDAVAMGGYMKPNDPTYLLLQERIEDLDAINRAAATLVLGKDDDTIEDMYDWVPTRLDEQVCEEAVRRIREPMTQAIRTDDPDLTASYRLHLRGSCHDLNALRGLLDSVERIDHVDLHADIDVLDAYLVFEGGIQCAFTSSFNRRKEWE